MIWVLAQSLFQRVDQIGLFPGKAAIRLGRAAEMAIGADERVIQLILAAPSMRELSARRASRDEALPYVDDLD